MCLYSMFPPASELYRMDSLLEWLHDAMYDALSGVKNHYSDHEDAQNSLDVRI
jgi:hypothetical protein